MKVYLAARYSRNPEMRTYRAELEREGIVVTSRWINGDHEWDGSPDGVVPISVGTRFAQEDLEDLEEAELVVNFTEEPRAKPGRGGRHAEFGYALAQGKEMFVVGPREHVFHALPDVIVFNEWTSCRDLMISIHRARERIYADEQGAAQGA